MAVQATYSMAGLSVQRDRTRSIARTLPEETPVAVVFNGITAAVMMATPEDIADFAHGFALTEGIVDNLNQIESFEILPQGTGIEARFWLSEDRAAALDLRRRSMLGPVGCGLCGIDSLEQAIRPLPVLAAQDTRLTTADIAQATDLLRDHQPLHDQTHAVHAAGFLVAGQGIVLAREDVGRHNALDKLIGALALAGTDPASGAIVLTSRVSVEMVQKTVIAGCTILVAVSAPTAHALRLALDARLTVAAFAKGGGFDVYACPERISAGSTDAA